MEAMWPRKRRLSDIVCHQMISDAGAAKTATSDHLAAEEDVRQRKILDLLVDLSGGRQRHRKLRRRVGKLCAGAG